MQNGSGASCALLITMVLRWETGTSCPRWPAWFIPRFLRMRAVWELENGLGWYRGRADTNADLLMAVELGRGASAFFRLASCSGLWSSVGAWKCMALSIREARKKRYEIKKNSRFYLVSCSGMTSLFTNNNYINLTSSMKTISNIERILLDCLVQGNVCLFSVINVTPWKNTLS